jgi:hypothetical protein
MKNDLLARLERANPIGDDDFAPTSPQAVALKQRVVLSDCAKPLAARRRPTWRALAIAAVLVAGGASALVSALVGDKQVGASDAAAAVLERAAAGASTYANPAAGRYAYTRAETLYGGTRTDDPPFTYFTKSMRETWVAADGSGRVRELPSAPIFLGERDRQRFLASGEQLPPPHPTDRRVRAHYKPVPSAVLTADPTTLDLQQLDQLVSAVAQLPTDPDRLEAIIRAYAQKKDPPVESAMFGEISDLLNSPYASAELRATLYRVLARIDGVSLAGATRAPAGRAGVAVDAPVGYSDATRQRIVIDPRTGRVLAAETVLTKRVDWVDSEPGTVIQSIVYLDEGWSDSLDERPTHIP